MTKDDTFRTLAEIEAKEIDWLWPSLIPYEKTTILEGDPELGKSYLCMHIAALVTRAASCRMGHAFRRVMCSTSVQRMTLPTRSDRAWSKWGRT